MRLPEKKEVVERWEGIFGKATVVILADYSGLTSNQMNELRAKCRASNVGIQVVKNTLARRALGDGNMKFLVDHLKGPVAIAYSEEDQTAPAKVLVKATEEFKKLEVLVGALDGQMLSPDGVVTLSKMPGRDELRAQFLGLLNAVPGGFVRLLNAVPGGMVNVLDARKRSLEDAA